MVGSIKRSVLKWCRSDVRTATAVLVISASTLGCGASSRSAGLPTPLAERHRDTAVAPARTSHAARSVRESGTDGLQSCRGHDGPKAVALPARVTFGDFWQALAAQVALLDTSALEAAFEAFAARHELNPETPGLRQDFMRLWVAFEATRDGGWWRLRWSITDQEPSSTKIWNDWRRAPPQSAFALPSAVAECDEISALFSVTARRLGVRGVGLFYPTWNHVIAGWTPTALSEQSDAPVVLIPTTQIFQGCEATFDQTSFAAPKRVYEYPRYDVRDSTEIPTELAAFLLEQVRAYGEASPRLLGLIRAKRAALLRSSLGQCDDYRKKLAAELIGDLGCADQRALQHLADEELHDPSLKNDAVLSWLAAP